ncbi:MAG: lysine--tRNA ligase [Candidatus Poribacteria bacterium]|nr:lysine--tRNA ligase [Candidatus Poribacteria bacterium]
MEETKDLIQQRRQKLNEIRELGVEPYPHKYEPTHSTVEIHKDFGDVQETPDETKTVRIAGRIMTKRDHGKSSFAHLQDGEGKIQIYVRRDKIGAAPYIIYRRFDSGDIIGVEGTVFRTRTGELTVLADAVQLLSKSIRPLPEKWHGLQDKQTRYRQRYADLIMNPEVKDVFLKRTQIVQAIRDMLNAQNFIEVETPVLQPIYGGANARPFTTYHNTLEQSLYLRIANELYLKRLIVGGFERVYEFSRDFRNEGMDRDHNPEFTMLELYQAYADYHQIMELTETLIAETVKTIHGTTKIHYQAHELDFTPPWRRLRMVDAVREHSGIDPVPLSADELYKEAVNAGVNNLAGDETKGEIIAELFDTFAESKLIQPTFITDYPIEVSPFAKKKPEDPAFVERFECFICGMEVVNAFSELNDPIDQRQRFLEQASNLEAGDDEAFMVDEDYLRALEYGMPPTGGLGIGIDRLTMLLTNQYSIRDVILFPQMRPEN